jgi:hypothetical protein
VKNRVQEIKKLTEQYTWKYCPTAANPADILSRGTDIDDFRKKELWFKGPTWITNRSKWPEWTSNRVISAMPCIQDQTDGEEIRKTQKMANQNLLPKLLSLENYSSFQKLQRVTAYILRFIGNCRQRRENRNLGHLTVEEINKATLLWIKDVQHCSFQDVLHSLESGTSNHLIRQLKLYLDDEGRIRCRGRIDNAPVSDDTKTPSCCLEKIRLRPFW